MLSNWNGALENLWPVNISFKSSYSPVLSLRKNKPRMPPLLCLCPVWWWLRAQVWRMLTSMMTSLFTPAQPTKFTWQTLLMSDARSVRPCLVLVLKHFLNPLIVGTPPTVNILESNKLPHLSSDRDHPCKLSVFLRTKVGYITVSMVASEHLLLCI